MFVEAHIIAWNEAETIHLTIKHYQQFCKRIIIYDNFSTDNTREIAESMGCEVKLFGRQGVLDDREYTKLKNSCWKDSDAQWVIIVDADEILENPMVWNTDVTIYKTYGWNVFSHDVPRENWLEITTGFHDPQYSKVCCFNPKAIKEINYVHGCHIAKPVGDISYSNGLFTLFHYRNIGGPERLVERHKLYRERMSDWNIRWKAGGHYLYEDSQRRKEWKEQYDKSVEYYSPGTE